MKKSKSTRVSRRVVKSRKSSKRVVKSRKSSKRVVKSRKPSRRVVKSKKPSRRVVKSKKPSRRVVRSRKYRAGPPPDLVLLGRRRGSDLGEIEFREFLHIMYRLVREGRIQDDVARDIIERVRPNFFRNN